MEYKVISYPIKLFADCSLSFLQCIQGTQSGTILKQGILIVSRGINHQFGVITGSYHTVMQTYSNIMYISSSTLLIQ